MLDMDLCAHGVSMMQGNLNPYMTVPRFWPGANNDTYWVGYTGK